MSTGNEAGFSLEELDYILAQNSFLTTLEANTGLKRRYLAAGAFVALLYACAAMVTTGVLCTLACCAYPMYGSLRALDKGADTREWLTTWVVLVLFVASQAVLEPLLGWVPFYYMFALSFMVYVSYPKTKGGVLIYERWLRPALRPVLQECATAMERVDQDVVQPMQTAANAHGGARKSD